MRYKDQGSMGEPEQRRSRGWEAEPGRRRGPRSEDHRPHGHRGGGREGRRGGPAGPGAPFGRGRGRAQRGDVRTAILLLPRRPTHPLPPVMQAIVLLEVRAPGRSIRRSRNSRMKVWSPPKRRAAAGWSPLPLRVAASISRSAAHDSAIRSPTSPVRLIAQTLRDPMHQLLAAVRQIEVGGSATQLEAASQVLAQARRSLYLILAGESAEEAGGAV